MLHIINTCGQIENLFDHGVFAYDKWEKYMNAICPDEPQEETAQNGANTMLCLSEGRSEKRICKSRPRRPLPPLTDRPTFHKKVKKALAFQDLQCYTI